MSPTCAKVGESGPQITGVVDISCLPNEILALILESAHEQGYQRGAVQSRPAEEIIVSHVCSLWRNTALATPSLWARYRCIKPSPQQFAARYVQLQTYLTRSGVDADLDLVFDFVNVPVKLTDPTVMEMVNLVVPNLYRLKRFVLLSDGTNFVTPFHRALTGVSAPRLEHFEVLTGKYHNIMEEGYDGKPHWDPKILTEGPSNIKFLRLDSPASGRFRPPLNNLVHFCLEAGTPRLELLLLWVCLEQVLSLPFIETFSLWDVVIAGPNPGHPLLRIEAKRLRHVRFGRRPPPVSAMADQWPCYPLFFFLHYVSAPLLETMTISSVTLQTPQMPVFPLVQGEASLDYAFPNLKSLFLNNIIYPRSHVDLVAESRTVDRLLHATATIEHLCISTNVALHGDELMKALPGQPEDLDSGGYRAWPLLRKLTLSTPNALWEEAPSTELLQHCIDYWQKLATIHIPSSALPFVPTLWEVPHMQDLQPRSFWESVFKNIRPPSLGEGSEGFVSRREVHTEEIRQDDLPMCWPPGYEKSSGVDNGNFDLIFRDSHISAD
ncbi:hypothetical protein MD484_g3025, partial [Candolleomyces efflorescens]